MDKTIDVKVVVCVFFVLSSVLLMMAKVIGTEHISKPVTREIFNETNKEIYFKWSAGTHPGGCISIDAIIVLRLYRSAYTHAIVSLFMYTYSQMSKPPQIYPALDRLNYACRV